MSALTFLLGIDIIINIEKFNQLKSPVVIMKRLMTTSIIFFFLIPICPFVIAEERYRGRIHHYGRYSDIYLSKEEDSIDSMNKLLDAIRKIEEIRDLRERRELKRRYELEIKSSIY